MTWVRSSGVWFTITFEEMHLCFRGKYIRLLSFRRKLLFCIIHKLFAYVANVKTPSQMDVALWSYKWVGWSIEHLTVLYNCLEINKADSLFDCQQIYFMNCHDSIFVWETTQSRHGWMGAWRWGLGILESWETETVGVGSQGVPSHSSHA